MSQIWIYSMVSVLVVSLISFFGVLTLVFKQYYLKGFLLFMVSFSAGTLLGDVFIHLLPELVKKNGFSLTLGLNIIGGILLFFVLEKIVHWRHCHFAGTNGHVHPLTVMNLVGDSLHNFIDGALIAGSYLFSFPIGLTTTMAVIFHEIPHEIGNFAVFLHAGVPPKKALFMNFLSALTSFLGLIFVLAINFSPRTVADFIIPITIGGFLYVANTDLIPELHKDVKISNSIVQLISFLIGVGVMASLLLLPFE